VLDDRLYALRQCARKHGVGCDDLPDLIPNLSQKRTEIGDVSAQITKAEHSLAQAHAAYIESAKELSISRIKAAKKLQEAVQSELAPLKLPKARFYAEVTYDETATPTATGSDDVRFSVTTNEGQAAGILSKIASGGELSRFMLALKLVLGVSSPVCTLVFDEIDSGMGGATAASIGLRLLALGKNRQTLIVTHAPQVAAYANVHYIVQKASQNGTTKSSVSMLSGRFVRGEELARMLAGQNITEEARKAADKLLDEAAAEGVYAVASKGRCT
jgi:DNA repair protein RecN (Recombination protein N)